jgi:hypothetical protein
MGCICVCRTWWALADINGGRGKWAGAEVVGSGRVDCGERCSRRSSCGEGAIRVYCAGLLISMLFKPHLRVVAGCLLVFLFQLCSSLYSLHVIQMRVREVNIPAERCPISWRVAILTHPQHHKSHFRFILLRCFVIYVRHAWGSSESCG